MKRPYEYLTRFISDDISRNTNRRLLCINLYDSSQFSGDSLLSCCWLLTGITRRCSQRLLQVLAAVIVLLLLKLDTAQSFARLVLSLFITCILNHSQITQHRGSDKVLQSVMKRGGIKLWLNTYCFNNHFRCQPALSKSFHHFTDVVTYNSRLFIDNEQIRVTCFLCCRLGT